MARVCIARGGQFAKRGSEGGFSLVEVIIALTALGLVVAPMLAFFTASEQMRVRSAEAASQREWAALPGQLLAVGLPPDVAFAERGVLADRAAGRARPWVRRQMLAAADNLPRLTVVAAGFGEEAPIAAGLELGPAASLPLRRPTASPLDPILHETPLLSPANGALIALESLDFSGGAGELSVHAQPRTIASGPTRAVVEFGALRGQGNPARIFVPATDVVMAPSGRAWVELDGSLVPGAVRMELSDGRSRWFVPEGGRFRRHEPSASVEWSHRLAGPPPELVLGGAVHAGSSDVPFDYAQAVRARSELGSGLRFPPVYTAAFGSAPQTVPLGLGRVFLFRGEAHAGPDALSQAFRPGRLAGWASGENLAVQIATGSRLEVGAASWTLRRVRTRLPAPELVSAPYFTASFGATFAGSVTLRAPAGQQGVAGLLQVNDRMTNASSVTHPLP